MATKKISSFSEQVSEALTYNERTNRWLIGKIKEKGIDLTDTQLSNRLKEIHPFRDEEIILIKEILGI